MERGSAGRDRIAHRRLEMMPRQSVEPLARVRVGGLASGCDLGRGGGRWMAVAPIRVSRGPPGTPRVYRAWQVGGLCLVGERSPGELGASQPAGA